MSRHRWFLTVVGLLVLALGALGLNGGQRLAEFQQTDLPGLREVTGRLALTDLALWTEARYTRHPSQADRFTPFQDFPGAPEHFPAGSIVAPPRPLPSARPEP